jgi:DNA mismatch repair protein MSH2
MRIEVWRQESGRWVLGDYATPGNIQGLADLMFDNVDIRSSSVIMAINVAQKAGEVVVGVAFTEATSGRTLGVAEFPDDSMFSNLESAIIQQNTKECLVSDSLTPVEAEKLDFLFERCQVLQTKTERSRFSTKTLEKDLNSLLDSETLVDALEKMKMTAAMAALGALLDHLNLVDIPSNHGEYTLFTYTLGQYMKLDATAVEALHLRSATENRNKATNLYSLLNKCKTAAGSRLLSQWLKQPLLSLSEIEKRQNLVQVFYDDEQSCQLMQVFHLM